MRGPKPAYPIELTDDEVVDLRRLIRAHTGDHFKPGAECTRRPACFVFCLDAIDSRIVLMA
jgi:hypothetical protein